MSQFSSCSVITLTTDFGVDSPYVAQMKGVILSLNPNARIVDVCHGIAPQDIRGGAIVLADVCFRFPAQTIHVAVVDPGVGTERRIVFARIGDQCFVAPDNGLLTLVAKRAPVVELISVSKQAAGIRTVSPTFHGRDVMAPVAAALSTGANPQDFGDPLQSLVMLPIPSPKIEADRIVGQVIQIDSFGNLITNIHSEDLEIVNWNAEMTAKLESAAVHFGSTKAHFVRTYACRAAGELIALIGSSGRLELAIVNGSAASALAAKVDDQVVMSW